MSPKCTRSAPLAQRLRDAADAIEELNRLDAREDWTMWNAAQLRRMSGVLEEPDMEASQ